MLRACIALTHPPHHSMGSFVRVEELLRSLTGMGVQFDVVTPFMRPFPNIPGVRMHSADLAMASPSLSELTYNVARSLLSSRKFARLLLKPVMLRRIIRNYADSLVRILRKDSGSIKILQGEQQIAAAACLEAARGLQSPVIASIHNIWSEELVAANIVSRGDQEYRAVRELEETVVQRSDKIVVVSELMRDFLIENLNADRGAILVVPPGGRIQVPPSGRPRGEFDVVYAGLLAYRARVDLLIESAPLVMRSAPAARFHVTKKGELLSAVRRMTRRLRVPVDFFWLETREELFDFLQSCTIGVIPSSADPPRLMGTPVKLFDYLSAGLPVVANDVGGWTSIIKEHKVGVVTGSHPEDFARGIVSLFEDRTKLADCARNGLRLIESEYNWDRSARILGTLYSRLS